MMSRLLLLLLLGALPLAGQDAGPITVVVQQSVSGGPLPNAEVLPDGRPPSRLTDGRGEVRLPWPGGGSFRLVVRQIGFAPFDSTLAARPANGRVVVLLKPVAYRLPDLATGIVRGCPAPQTAAQAERTAAILEQLQIGAQHFEAFRREYEWVVTSERRTADVVDAASGTNLDTKLEQTKSSDWGAPYRRGRVLEREGPTRDDDGFPLPPGRLSWSARLLFVSELASPRFWENHCFLSLESEPDEDEPTVQLAFSPRTFIKQPDWRGVAILDSATAELRRVTFELVNLDPARPPARLEGATEFVRVSPYVMIPAVTRAQFWFTPPVDGRSDGTWSLPDRVQRLTTMTLRWSGKRRPPGVDSLTILHPDLHEYYEARRRAAEAFQLLRRRKGNAAGSAPPADTVSAVTSPSSPVISPPPPRPRRR